MAARPGPRFRSRAVRRGKLNSHITTAKFGLDHVSSYVKQFGPLQEVMR
jgi:hypothetical protein